MTLWFSLSGLWHGMIGRKGKDMHRGGSALTDADLQAKVEAAHWEWQVAQQYFQAVTDPQLVDHAIHAIIASEQKYMYLLRKLRECYGVAHNQED
jgi:hypothetical protein